MPHGASVVFQSVLPCTVKSAVSLGSRADAISPSFLLFQSAAATAATLALPAGVTPVQQIFTNSGN